MSQLRHIGAVGVLKRLSTQHRHLLKGGGTKTAQAGHLEDAINHGVEFLAIIMPTHLSAIFQLSWLYYQGLGGKLSSGGRQPREGPEEVGSDGKDLGTVGREHAGVGYLF